MTNTTNIIIVFTTIATIGWSLYFYMLWLNHRAPRAPKVSDDAVKVSILIFRDFTRLCQGACQQAKEKMSEQFGVGGGLLTEIMDLPMESVADHNRHNGSGISWGMEYNPSGRSYITLHGENENLKWEIFSYLGHMVCTQTDFKTLISVA
jgi:hypothetical protein